MNTGAEIGKGICIVIPHSGLLCPPEIAPSSLSSEYSEIAYGEIDWYSQYIYHFTDLIGNQEFVFPYSQVLINVNRHPRRLDDSVPISFRGKPIYKAGCEPSVSLQKLLIRKYHAPFHKSIEQIDKDIILDCHSTIPGHEDLGGRSIKDEDIIVSCFQKSPLDCEGGIRTAPEGYLETYVNELSRRLQHVKISASDKEVYTETYGHTMAQHGWDGQAPRFSRAPLLLQETNEKLYVRDGRILLSEVEYLRRAFAEALYSTVVRLKK